MHGRRVPETQPETQRGHCHRLRTRRRPRAACAAGDTVPLVSSASVQDTGRHTQTSTSCSMPQTWSGQGSSDPIPASQTSAAQPARSRQGCAGAYGDTSSSPPGGGVPDPSGGSGAGAQPVSTTILRPARGPHSTIPRPGRRARRHSRRGWPLLSVCILVGAQRATKTAALRAWRGVRRPAASCVLWVLRVCVGDNASDGPILWLGEAGDNRGGGYNIG